MNPTHVSRRIPVVFLIVVILIPGASGRSRAQSNAAGTTPSFQIIPDSELVYSPAASDFDLVGYVKSQPGLLRSYVETVSGRRMGGVDSVRFVATSTSVNPRLLLALLEYRAGWLTNPNPSPDAVQYPLGKRDYPGLFGQLVWAANVLNEGYYGWKNRGATTLQFADNTGLAYASDLNAATIALQFFFAQTAADETQWQSDILPYGFRAAYERLFGDPFAHALEPLVPSDVQQPDLVLPFPRAVMWYFTAGPHGGWGRTTSGWSAVDFAPPKPVPGPKCYVSPYVATAVAAGLIVRSADGVVVLDLDMDGDEHTGWTILYLHIAAADRVKVGTLVQPGSPIGYPSCEGFYLNSPGTHLHIARQYNGEWIPADCWACRPDAAAPPFVMSGWRVRGYPKRASEGWMERDGQIRRMTTGRQPLINGIVW